MRGTLCLALRMERLYKPVRYVALGRALPHDIWIGTAGAIRLKTVTKAAASRAARQFARLACLLALPPPLFVFGHEEVSWQKFFARFFTQPLAVSSSRHFLPASETARVARHSSSSNGRTICRYLSDVWNYLERMRVADARRVRERARTGGADSADEREAGLMFLKGKDNWVTAPGEQLSDAICHQTDLYLSASRPQDYWVH